MKSSILALIEGECIVLKGDRRGGEYRGKLQISRQYRRVETRELCKINVDGLLIKIVENRRLWVDANMLIQRTVRQYMVLYLIYSKE